MLQYECYNALDFTVSLHWRFRTVVGTFVFHNEIRTVSSQFPALVFLCVKHFCEILSVTVWTILDFQYLGVVIGSPMIWFAWQGNLIWGDSGVNYLSLDLSAHLISPCGRDVWMWVVICYSCYHHMHSFPEDFLCF